MADDRQEQVKRLFDAAVVLAPEQRKAFLSELDPSLRDEIESLLFSHHQSSFPEKTPAGADSLDEETVEKATAVRPPPQPPSRHP